MVSAWSRFGNIHFPARPMPLLKQSEALNWNYLARLAGTGSKGSTQRRRKNSNRIRDLQGLFHEIGNVSSFCLLERQPCKKKKKNKGLACVPKRDGK